VAREKPADRMWNDAQTGLRLLAKGVVVFFVRGRVGRGAAFQRVLQGIKGQCRCVADSN
jgi:hypothetical protein